MQNTRRTWEAFKSLDTLVVGDFFMTPSAELADFVLPATTWLERDDCCDEQYMNCIAARQRAVAPRHESRDDVEMVIDLVQRLPWADRKYIPWNSAREFNDYRLKGTGLNFDQFKEQGYIKVDLKTRQYEQDGFRTPTGKVEIYSTIFEKHGYDPLPYYTEPPESPVASPELMKDYPYILFTGGRNIEYYHSAGQQVEVLRKRRPDPEIDLHPDAAQKESLEAGDWVWLETPQVKGERVSFKVRITDGVDPRTIHAQHSWWYPEKPGPDHGCFESNISVVLTDDEPREPICGSTNLRATLCRIYKMSVEK